MEGIKVSVIVCCYNQEKYIKQTLDSILSQEHPYTYEIIVCDDASQDSTPDIVTEYAEKHPEIIPVLRKQNLGVVKNFFDGVSRCRGDYIMGCAGDDYYLPGKIFHHVFHLETHPEIGLLHSDVKLIAEDGSPKRIKLSSNHKSVEHLICNYNINAPTISFRKSILSEYLNDVHPEEKDWPMEDLPISLWFYINNHMSYFPDINVAYRIVDNSISHQISIDKKFAFEKACFEVLKYFQQKYPRDISNRTIFIHHLKVVLSLNDKDKYLQYCNQIFSCCKKQLNIIKLLYFKARINSSPLNKFVLFLITNWKRCNIIMQAFIRVIK